MVNVLVNGIVWESKKVSKVLSSEKTENSVYFEEASQIDAISESDNIYFSNMIWDFTVHRRPGEAKNLYLFDFTEIKSNEHIYFLKKALLRELYIKENRFSTVHRTLTDLKKFIKYLEKRLISIPIKITSKIVEHFINEECKTLKQKTLLILIGNIKKYLSEIEYSYSSFRLADFNKILVIDNRELKAEIETGKFPNIPRLLLNKIVQCALNDINDNRIENYITVKEFAECNKLSKTTILNQIKEGCYPGCIKMDTRGNGTYLIPKSYINNSKVRIEKTLDKDEFLQNPPPTVDEKLIACMILLFSQIGLRRSEFILLETNKLKEISIQNGSKKVFYLEFFTFKTSITKDGKLTETWMNDIALKAYETLQNLTADRRDNGQVALYPTKNGDFYKNKNIIDAHFKQFFIRHQDKLEIEKLESEDLAKLHKWIINENNVKYRFKSLKHTDIGKVIYKVSSHQFRVSVANELRDKGVSLQWIKKHMNHLEEEMTKHYFRSEKIIKETLLYNASEDGGYLEDKYSKSINSELIMDDPEIVKAYETVNKFLKKNKFNVFKDLNQILKLLKDSPINETEVGYCMLSMGKICERQNKLAALEKWYYVKPQIPDIHNFDFTYKRLIEKFEIVKHNESAYLNNQKYLRQYELEKKALKKFCENKFLPELNLLKEEVRINNIENTVKKFPDLRDVIFKINDIETEVLQWLNNQS